ncbi:MAG TPA: M48 family metallopeptidase [Thermoanaerobaculia bacterium]|nr:M48 family metallopeptidase [Thermoanaerobaculia bacterium]
MLRTARTLTIPLLLLFAVGCGSAGLGGSSISRDQEWQLGNQMAAQVASQVQLVHDAQALSYVRMVGERIHAVTPIANLPFDFEIVNDPTVNAFSLPGGHVYVNTGLIAHADKVDELAAVLAHEISHVVNRDAIKQVEQANTINAVGSILLGQNPGALEQIVAQIVAGGTMARFSRADEKRADDDGLVYMAQAGYDPHGMLDLFRVLLALNNTQPNAVAAFFQDHPGTQDRINDIEGRLNKMAIKNGIQTDPQYQVIRRQIT